MVALYRRGDVLTVPTTSGMHASPSEEPMTNAVILLPEKENDEISLELTETYILHT